MAFSASALLGRDELPAGPVMRWTPRMSIHDLGGGLLAMDVDVEPYRGPRRLAGSSNRMLVIISARAALGKRIGQLRRGFPTPPRR